VVRGVGQHAAVVFDAHVQRRINLGGGYVHRFLGVDEHVLVLFGVVGCARRDAQHVLRGVRYFWHVCSFLVGCVLNREDIRAGVGLVVAVRRILAQAAVILLRAMTCGRSRTRVSGARDGGVWRMAFLDLDVFTIGILSGLRLPSSTKQM
jgi:hypothetical protein